MKLNKSNNSLISPLSNQLITTSAHQLIISFLILNFSFLIPLVVFSQPTQVYTKTTGVGNPISIDPGPFQLTQADNATAGWTAVTFPAGAGNKWSNAVTFPVTFPASPNFSFKFFGENVTGFKVTQNGVLTFTTAAVSVPAGNTNLPALSLPNKSIACTWDAYTIAPPLGANDIIHTRMLNLFPHRQYWVRWTSYEIGNPAKSDACFAIVFEETSNAIYIVDMYKGTPLATNLTATMGLQYDNRYYYSQATATNLLSGSTAYTNNNWVKFTPTPITSTSVLYKNADLSACSASGNIRTLIPTPTPTCPASTLKSCTLYASLNLGNDYEYGSNGTFADSTGADLAVSGYNAAGALLFSGSAHLVINQTSVEKLYELEVTAAALPNISYFTVGISNFIQSANVNVQNDVTLLVWTETEFKVNLSVTSPTITLNTVNPAVSPVQFSWSPSCPGIPQYEFQLMRLYNEGGESYYDVTKATGTIDWDNALKLIVEDGATSLSLHLKEGTGYYAWRVRPIGNYYSGEEANDKNWGLWSAGRQQGATYNLDPTDVLGAGTFYYTETEDSLNWIYNRVFTENNNVGENMTYGDGVGRTKQTQHHLQSAGEVLVSQQLYDYAGRGALKSMAGPVEINSFNYQELFLTSDVAESQLYRAKDFDGSATYKNPSAVQGGDLNAYYSDNNTDSRIPNAEGFPFSRSLYYADGTNRPKEISTPGALFQIGNTTSGVERTIKIYYSAVSDPELIKIFGDEAAVDTSVYKSIQIDPNKVTTVTYHTVDGKTIATCLADGGDLSLLDDLANTPDVIEDVIEGNISSGLNTYTKEKSVTITQPGVELWASYEITPAQIEATCGSYCSTCDYTVYGYIKENGNVLWDTTITILPSACNLPQKVSSPLMVKNINPLNNVAKAMPSFYGAIITDEVATFTVGRSISIDNDDPYSANTYLQNHQDTMAAIMDEHIAANFDEMYAYLEDDDIDGFYDYLVASGYATQQQIDDEIDVVVATECCSLTIPVETCPPHPCDTGTPDFEALLYTMWEDKYGNAFQNYSKHSSVFDDYPDNGTLNHALFPITSNFGTFIPSVDWPFSYFIFKIEYTGTDGTPKTFNLGNDTIGFPWQLNPLSSGDAIAEAIKSAIDAASYATYGVKPYSCLRNGTDPNIIEIYPAVDDVANIDDYKGVMNGTVTLSSPTGDFTITNPANAFNYTQEGSFPYGIGAFNRLVNNMIADGYPCDTLYDTWYTLCSTYEIIKDENNIVELFLESVGTMHGHSSAFVYGDYGYLSHAHEVIKYTSGDCPDCESQFDYAAMTDSDALDDIRTEADSLKTWYQFYNCAQTCDNGDINETLSGLGFDVDECDGTNDIACAEDMVEVVKDSCYSMCESRASSFEAAIRAEYAYEGLIVSEEEVICLVEALIEECQSGCGLTIFYHLEDTNADGTDDKVLDSVGSPAEILNLQQSLTYSFDLRIPTDSTCVAMGYKSINNGFYVYEYINELLVEELNAYLNAFLDSSDDNDTIYPSYVAAVILSVLVQNQLVLYPFSCNIDILADMFFAAQNATPYPVDSNSYFYTEYNCIYLKYWSDTMPTPVVLQDGSIVYLREYDSVGVTCIFQECNAYWLCGPICFKWVFPTVNREPDTVDLWTCEESAAEFLMGYIDGELQKCKDGYITDITEAYEDSCADPNNINDVLTMGYTQGYFHYTLFYYDRGGNLVETVPPKGVDEANDSRMDSPNDALNAEGHYHTYKTLYKYNSRKQMVAKSTPDGGVTTYYYNDLGQLRFSQNAVQAATKKYSYLKYDNLGRVSESGQANICNTCPITSVAKLTEKVNTTNVPATGGEEKTFTIYTTPAGVLYTDADGLTHSQEFLTNRISYVYNDEDGNIATTTDQNYTYYSYDAHGNVEWLIQSVAGLANKQIGFVYDLVSGKITEVKYQEGMSDQYFYKYKYDADNRLTGVQTSRNGRIYDVDATYEYYAHGPLERVVLGEDKVQGLDYLYTLQGWLKAVNHPQLNSGYDPGQDGVTGTNNKKVPADAFGMVLNYYNGDFNRTGSVYNPSYAPTAGSIVNKFSTSTHDTADYKSYYNGFISNIISNNAAAVSNNAGMPMVGMYLYDEIGRLTQSTIDFYSGSNMTGNWIGNTGSGSNYYEHFGYDVNGNIINVTRNGY